MEDIDEIKLMKRILCKGNNHAGHEFVDLGLPSGTLWSKYNMLSESNDDPGGYCSFGYTKLYRREELNKNGNIFSRQTYDIFLGDLRKIDYKLPPKYDAATVNWGGRWRMPTIQECSELLYYTTKIRYDSFLRCFSKNDERYIDIPCSGHVIANTIYSDVLPYLWTSSIGLGGAIAIACFDSYSCSNNTVSYNPWIGLPIRPVFKIEKKMEI